MLMRPRSFMALLLFISFLFLGRNAYAQEVAVDTAIHKRFSIFPLPLVAANPTVGVMFGFTPSVSFFMADPATTSMSTAIVVALMTTKSQVFSSIRSNAFLKEDKWAILLDTRYNINNQPTFGLGSIIETVPLIEPTFPGETAVRKERIYFNMLRFYGTALRKHQDSRLFYGFGYLFDAMTDIHDVRVEPYTNTLGNTYHQEYQLRKDIQTERYTQSGISLNAMWDSRDNVGNPYTGSFSMFSWRAFPSFLGSTGTTSQLWMEQRNYVNLSKNRPRHLLAFWAYGWFVTSGNVPYLFLPATGWDMYNRSARPYTFGRFRGEDLVYSELEWRFPLLLQKDWLGGVAFLNATSASSRFEQINLFDYMQVGYGLGLRIKVIPKKRVNLGVDYGWGAKGASGLFINLYEVF
jgi:hypothetical protein